MQFMVSAPIYPFESVCGNQWWICDLQTIMLFKRFFLHNILWSHLFFKNWNCIIRQHFRKLRKHPWRLIFYKTNFYQITNPFYQKAISISRLLYMVPAKYVLRHMFSCILAKTAITCASNALIQNARLSFLTCSVIIITDVFHVSPGLQVIRVVCYVKCNIQHQDSINDFWQREFCLFNFWITVTN